MRSWIQTKAGLKFHPLDPKPEDILLTDIARALSMQCRYAGHVSQFYSVAEHSVHIVEEVERRNGTRNQMLMALFHDADEAYLPDLPRPIKHQPFMEGYREAGKTLEAMVFKKFGIDQNQADVEFIKLLDNDIIGSEAVRFKQPIHPDWPSATALGYMAAPWPGWETWGWAPFKAERVFLSWFDRLWVP